MYFFFVVLEIRVPRIRKYVYSQSIKTRGLLDVFIAIHLFFFCYTNGPRGQENYISYIPPLRELKVSIKSLAMTFKSV